MRFKTLHAWDLTPKEAIALQGELAQRISLTETAQAEISVVGGVDVSYQRRAELFHAAVVVMSLPDLEIRETVTASDRGDFPYVPGLLSFRELPVVLRAFEKLRTLPDVVLVDGQGIAHPRKFGLASHLGLWLDLPTIGCAKSRLCGNFEEPGARRGSWTPLTLHGEELGRVLRSRDRVKPMFISPGHKIDCRLAVDVVLRCGGGYRLPEPTRQAHLLSNRVRTEVEVKHSE